MFPTKHTTRMTKCLDYKLVFVCNVSLVISVTGKFPPRKYSPEHSTPVVSPPGTVPPGIFPTLKIPPRKIPHTDFSPPVNSPHGVSSSVEMSGLGYIKMHCHCGRQPPRHCSCEEVKCFNQPRNSAPAKMTLAVMFSLSFFNCFQLKAPLKPMNTIVL